MKNSEAKEKELQKQIDDLTIEKTNLEKIIEKQKEENNLDDEITNLNLNTDEIISNLANVNEIKNEVANYNKKELVAIIQKLNDKEKEQKNEINELNNLFSGLSDNIVKDPEIHNKIESLIKDIKDIQQVVNRKTQTHFRPRRQTSKNKKKEENNS